MEKIKSVAQLVGYCEIDTNPDTETKWFVDSKLSLVYKPLVDKKFKMAEVTGKEDVWPAFNKFFSKST